MEEITFQEESDNEPGLIVNSGYNECKMRESEEILDEDIIHDWERIQDDRKMEKYEQNKEQYSIYKEKREREEEEWTVIKKKEKKHKIGDIIEIYISSNVKMPKQFAIAKLFREEGILEVEKVRYINPYKIRVDVTTERTAEKLEKCKKFIDSGWRIQRAMEVNFSYGVIKDIDLELTEEEILKSIKCPELGQLESVHRLKRREEGKGWQPSEAVRLCFKGSFRPPYVFVDHLRIHVEPYVFPVTQCSRCWRFGHSIKKCPVGKVVCPKCCGNHANCDTVNFKCINCEGQHMALVKTCPAFQKEKKLRELMAEYNCTYRRALTLYVHPNESHEIPEPNEDDIPNVEIKTEKPSFARIVTCATIHNSSNTNRRRIVVRRKKEKSETDWSDFEIPPTQEESAKAKDPKEETEKNVKLSELLRRLQDIILLKGVTMQSKVHSVIKCCVEWVILVVVENISDWPILKVILNYFCQE